ncbi:hypothetical protein MRX96_057047 [Rhipicephalus microplus]
MLTPTQRCTVVGFSNELDWRPLSFAEPLPSYRVCQACGLVPRVTALLPCLHVYCKSCFEQCRLDSGHCCLLDGQPASTEDVEWREFPVRNLLKRMVKCWNEDRGCDVVLPASELNKHFCKDCDHHSTSCPRCSMVVRCNSVCAHMQSECMDHVMSVPAASPQTNSSSQNATMMALNANMYTRVGQIKDTLDHLTQENITQSNCLNEISQYMNTMKETLQEISHRTRDLGSVVSASDVLHSTVTLNHHGQMLQELSGTMGNSHEALKDLLYGTKRSVEELKKDTTTTLRADLKEIVCGEGSVLREAMRRDLEDVIKTASSHCAETVAAILEVKECENKAGSIVRNKEKIAALSSITLKRHEFSVEGLSAIKGRTLASGFCAYDKKKVYTSGYHLSPGIYFKRDGQHVLVCPHIRLHKGIIDSVLQWPFDENFRLTIKHPSQSKECQRLVVASNTKEYARPDTEHNVGVYSTARSFRLDELEREGYIAGDKLQVVWELVSKNNSN